MDDLYASFRMEGKKQRKMPQFGSKMGHIGLTLGFQGPIGNAIGRQQAAAAKVMGLAGQ